MPVVAAEAAPALSPMMIGLMAGLGKSALVDAPKEKKQRQLQAATAAYSPWTGMQAQAVTPTDTFGNALQGYTAGAMYEQNAAKKIQDAKMLEAQQQNIEAQTELMKKQGMMSPASRVMGPPMSRGTSFSPYQNMGAGYGV